MLQKIILLASGNHTVCPAVALPSVVKRKEISPLAKIAIAAVLACVSCLSVAQTTSQTISIEAVPNLALGAVHYLRATGGGSGNPIVITTTTSTVCSISGTLGLTLSTLSSGTCSITANQAGNEFYDPAAPVTRSFPVGASTVFWYRFGDVDPGAVLGSVTNSTTVNSANSFYLAVRQSSPRYTQGAFGSSFAFETDGIDTGIEGITGGFRSDGNGPLIDQTDNFALEVFAKAYSAGIGSSSTITHLGDPFSNGAGIHRVGANYCAVFSSVEIFACTPWTTQWTHLALVREFGIATFYFNGVAVGTSNAEPLAIGLDSWFGTYIWTTPDLTFHGAIDEAKSFAFLPGGFSTQIFNAALQQIKFASTANIAVGANASVVANGGGSGNPVTFTSTTLAICDSSGVNGSVITGISVGTCTLEANQAGSSNYLPAAKVSSSFLITGTTAQAIQFAPAPILMIGGNSVVSATGGASANPIVFTSLSPEICSLSGSTVTAHVLAVCTIAANQAGNNNYADAAQVTQQIQIQKVTQVITFNPPSGLRENITHLLVASGGGSGNPVLLVSATPQVCTLNGFTLNTLISGLCTLSASQAGSSTYLPAVPVTRNIQIGVVTELRFRLGEDDPGAAIGNAVNEVTRSYDGNVLLNRLAEQPYVAGAPGSVMASSSDGLTGGFASGVQNVAHTLSDNFGIEAWVKTYGVGSGANSAIAYFGNGMAGGYGFYRIGNDYCVLFGQLQIFGCTPWTSDWTHLALVRENGLFSFYINGVAISTSPAVPLATAYKPTLIGNNNESAQNEVFNGAIDDVRVFSFMPGAFSLRSLSMSQQTISILTSSSLPLNQSVALQVSGGGSGNPVQLTSLTTNVCSLSGSNGHTVMGLQIGICSIRATQAGNAQFAAAPQITQNFQVSGVVQQITFNPVPDLNIGVEHTLVASGGASGNPVIFSSITPSVCSLSTQNNAIVSGQIVGTCSIAANQAGNAAYNAAVQVVRDFQITKFAQVINFVSIPNLPVGSTQGLTASGGASGIAVTFSSDTPSTCTINASNLSAIAAGMCTVTANQAGNATYAAANPVSRSAQMGLNSILNFRLGEDDPGALIGSVANGQTLSRAGNYALNRWFDPVYVQGAPHSAIGIVSNGVSHQISGIRSGFKTTAVLPAHNLNNNFGVEVWAKMLSQGTSENGAIVYFGHPDSGGYGIYRVGGNYCAVFGGVAVFGCTPWQLNEWTHLAIVRDAGLSTFYVNGVSAGTSLITPSPANAWETWVGSRVGNAPRDESFHGAVDSINVFTFAPGAFSVLSLDAAPQAIVFNPAPSLFLGATATVSASGGASGNPLVFSSTTPSTCSVSGSNGSTVLGLAVGLCTIAANQASSSNYTAAPQVTQDLMVGVAVPGAPTITTVTPANASATIAFNAPDNNGGSAILDYTARCVPSNAQITGANSPLQITGLPNGAMQTCSVSARNVNGSGPASASLNVFPAAILSADLSITKTNGVTFVSGGSVQNYQIVVSNAGPAGVAGALVVDILDPEFSNATWTCLAQNSAICATIGSGNLNERVDLPVAASVTFVFSAMLAPLPENPVSNVASVAPPAPLSDPNTANNVASDGPDIRGIFRDGFE